MAAKASSKNSAWAKVRARAREWSSAHNGAACAAIALGVAAALAGLFAFVAFSDFGGTATFIYNQF